MMVETPERIWAYRIEVCGIELGEWVEDPTDTSTGTKYVRADRLEAAERKASHWLQQARDNLKAGQDCLAKLEAAERKVAELEAERDKAIAMLETQAKLHRRAEAREARPFSTGRSGKGWSEYSQHSWATHWMPLPASPSTAGER